MKFIGLVLANFVTLFMEGFVLSNLWRWYVVPITDWPALSVAAAMGIAVLITMFYRTTKTNLEANNDSELLIRLIIIDMIKPWIALGYGWVVLQFI